ncbi:MAG: C4-dicarboxylate ABC transporter, partial [Desulfuromonadaceae bacterium]
MRRKFCFLSVLICILLAATPALAKPITIKFSHVVAVDTPKGQAAEYFKKLVEERSKGEIRVEVYPNASLHDDRDAIEAISMNAIQMAAPSFSKFTSFVPQLQ